MTSALGNLAEILRGTVSGRPEEVKRSEMMLESERRNFPEELPLRLLELVASEQVSMDVRLAGAIYLKNAVKKEFRGELIKDVIVKVMLQVADARNLQSQLSATISIIAEKEFPLKWTNLLPQLNEAMLQSAGEQRKLLGALECLDAVLEKYRSIARSEDVLRQMQMILKYFQQTHLDLFKNFVPQYLANPANRALIEIVSLVASIFQSMNAVDIPEFYQDNLGVWMQGFCAMLTTRGDSLARERLLPQLCDNFTLYADKYQEPFEAFVPETVKAVWTLLQNSETREEEAVVAAALKFLASAASTQWTSQCNPFLDPQALRAIVEMAILPNMEIQENDTEIFEDNPREYISRDIEGADQDTRRRAALDLVRSIAKFHDTEITSLMLAHAQNLLSGWKQKETCLYVIASLAIKGQTRSGGVSQLNDKVDFVGFFKTQMLPEISDTNVDKFPILRASILKFMTLFRNFLNLKEYTEIIGRHLHAKSEVVFTYAAHGLSYAIDQKTSGEFVKTTAVTLAQRLMQTPTPNEYAMKLFMVLSQFLDERTLAEATNILPTLLGKIIADPVNPMYTHFLFESIAVAISRATAIDQILAILVDGILAKNLVDFMPYAFQLLALILSRRTDASGVFANLFPVLMADEVWTNAACVPALVHLLAAYFGKPGNLFTSDAIQRVLSKIQLLLRKTSTEISGLDLIAHLFNALPLAAYQAALTPLLTFLLTEIRDRRTERKVRALAVALAAFIIVNGTSPLKAALEVIQPGLFTQVLRGLFLTSIPDIPNKVSRKVCIVAMCRVANEVDGEDAQNVLIAADALVTKIATGVSLGPSGSTEEPEITAESFEGHFVKLKHAAVSEDFAASVADEWALLRSTLKSKIPSTSANSNLPSLAQWLLA